MNESDTLRDRKAEARREAHVRRAAIDPARHGASLANHVLLNVPLPRNAVVAGTWPIGTEIDVLPLLQAISNRGHVLALPVTEGRGRALTFRRWRFGDPLIAGPLGTRQPPEGDAILPDVILVPVLAFDRAGRRLGYGGGYYDRTLAALPDALAVGCAHSGQEMDTVPAGDRDIRLALIGTEQGVLRCAG